MAVAAEISISIFRVDHVAQSDIITGSFLETFLQSFRIDSFVKFINI